MTNMLRFFSLLLLTLSGAHELATAEGADCYLADITAKCTITQGWGNLGVNTAAYGAQTPGAMRIGEKTYEHGLGHHAPGEIVVPLDGQFLSFKAEAGIQWQGGGRGSVVFEVWVDDEKRFEHGPMSDSNAAAAIDVPVAGAKTLRLAARDGGDGFSCDMANWADARLSLDPAALHPGKPVLTIDGNPIEGPLETEGSYALLGQDRGTQFAFARMLNITTVVVTPGQKAAITIPLESIQAPFSIQASAAKVAGSAADFSLALASGPSAQAGLGDSPVSLSVESAGTQPSDAIILSLNGTASDAAARLGEIGFTINGRTTPISLIPVLVVGPPHPSIREITMHPMLENEIIEWDWRMQDGIGTPNLPAAFAQATEKLFARGDALIADLHADQRALGNGENAWQTVRTAWDALRVENPPETDARWENVWRAAHQARRQIMLTALLSNQPPLLFVKQAPPGFSHQLTQYYGRYARPGGGIFVLDQPGVSMQARPLLPKGLPMGSWMHPEITYDGKSVLAAFCETNTSPGTTTRDNPGHYYHLWQVATDGSEARALTSGEYDDFSPKELPDGSVVFVSTRRGGMHRCGSPGCPVYTLTRMNRDGSGIRTISYHETQEWDPAVLNDGRIIYTRWDYVDRNAVHYQQLWSVRPDGSAPTAYYGNNTLNPVGVWEARPVPHSPYVMATAAPHHGMSAGSIILIDVAKGIDDLAPLTRLTPWVPFPESESPLAPYWRSALAPEPPERCAEMDRWPGQCFRSPYPLSERYFYAAYSFDKLIGEPKPNPANIFGLYITDSAGNQELLYRDLNLSSAWPLPLAARPTPPVMAPSSDESAPPEGQYLLENVYQSAPEIEKGSVKRLRIVQVLPKSTSGANNPTVGLANASPGKQVLGTVPVESDGSAYFTAPARIPMAFQALDELGQAVQVMRTVTYLQPGERASCVGCHEPRHHTSTVSSAMPLAARRAPSPIEPGPDGSKPLSYPILVQPVLDAHCIRCHSGEKPAGPEGKPIVLTGAPEERYTASYNALAPRVSFSSWGRGAFPEGNCEPLAKPGFFGAKGSPLMQMLLKGHNNVQLTPGEMDRLTTWMDANGLFYGTFNVEDQARQQRAERIAGPDLE